MLESTAAMNVPLSSALNTRPLAVAVTPAQPGPSYFTSHFACAPVNGSMARSAIRAQGPSGATVPPIVRSPTFSGVSFLKNFAHVSRNRQDEQVALLVKDGGMKFVLPYQSGHVTVPSIVGSCPGMTFGLPSAVKPFAQFWLPYE